MPENYFDVRMTREAGQAKVWKAITENLQSRFLKPDAGCVVDLGCGYGDFINQIQASTKVTLDLEEMKEHLEQKVEFYQSSIDAWDFNFSNNNRADLFFCSNLLEHLERPQAVDLLKKVNDHLKPGGLFIMIQPNFSRCAEHYFDDYTHVSIYTETSLCGLLQSEGFKISYSNGHYLPFSMRGTLLPKTYSLIKFYLMIGSPVLGAQMLVVAQKKSLCI